MVAKKINKLYQEMEQEQLQIKEQFYRFVDGVLEDETCSLSSKIVDFTDLIARYKRLSKWMKVLKKL